MKKEEEESDFILIRAIQSEMRFVLLMAIEAINGANFDYKFSLTRKKFCSSSSKFVYITRCN